LHSDRFLVGLELDPAQVSKTGSVALSIALSGIVLPFALGLLVALLLYNVILSKEPDYTSSFAALAVFTGVGMSITVSGFFVPLMNDQPWTWTWYPETASLLDFQAFPVLARILGESRLISLPVGKRRPSHVSL
jgi:hypothetical protein